MRKPEIGTTRMAFKIFKTLNNLFNGTRNNPKATTFHVSVKDAPVELPPFELKVSGLAAKAPPEPESGPGHTGGKDTQFNVHLDRSK